eukprot:jgi/Galph1/1928/GphlegSOOS_G595.1
MCYSYAYSSFEAAVGGLILYTTKSVVQIYMARKKYSLLCGTATMLSYGSGAFLIPNMNCRLPGPTPFPIIGNSMQLSSSLYETLFNYVEYPVSIYFIASTPFVVITDEVAVRKVLGSGLYRKPKYFGYRSNTIRYSVELQRVAAANEHKLQEQADSSRKALNAMIDERFPLILEGTLDVVKAMAQCSDADSQIQSLREKLIGLNMKILFNYDNCTDIRSLAYIISEAGKEFIQRTVNPFRILWNWIANVRYFINVFSLIAIGRRLCRHMEQQPATWVHGWVGKVRRIGRLGKVVGLVMASSQTVPTTCLWLLYLLAENERVVEKIREETDNVLKATNKNSVEELTHEELKTFVYADCVVKECLRLYPPFPLLQREPEMDDVLGDVCIPAKTPVYIVPWLLHHHSRYWSEPERFKPERFETNANHGDAPSGFVYIPFGRGSRMCAGYNLALLELKILLIYACQQYYWSCVLPHSLKTVSSPLIDL